MRAVIQRASSATVTIAGSVQASIGAGLLVLLGVEMTLVNDGPVTILIDSKARE